MLPQITKTIFFYERTKTKIRCVLAQITINKGQGQIYFVCVAQITTNIFFYERIRTKMCCVLTQITINKGQKYGQTKEVYGLTKINIWMASSNFAAALADGCELAFNNRNAYHLNLFNSVLF